MSSRTPDDLAEVAWRAFTDFCGLLDPRLAEVWSSLGDTRLVGGATPSEYLLSPASQPLLAVPVWAAELAGGVADEVLDDAVAAAVVGYHAIRLQDDLMDEDRGDAVATTLLATAAVAHAHALLGRWAHSRAFWDASSRLIVDYAGAMALERWLRDHPERYDDEAFATVLDRSGPLALPGLAILDHAGHWERAAALTALAGHATRALQVVDDLRDVRVDLERGNWTWVLTRIDALGAPEEAGRRLVAEFDVIVGVAREELEAASRLAVAERVESCAQWCEVASRHLDRFQQRFWEQRFGLD